MCNCLHNGSCLSEAPDAITHSVVEAQDSLGGTHFFDICSARGLSGDQGVLIPESNIKNLMLRRDVLDAVRDGRFHVYAVSTIDQGIETLTGVKAGERGKNGAFPPYSINGRVEARLMELAEQRRAFARNDAGDEPAQP